MSKDKMTILLDNGHGGLINGVYQTKGKRSPIWEDGSILYEGEFNRAIVNGIIENLTVLNIPYINITPELEDVSLKERVMRANKISNSVFISIHSNASTKINSGRGFEAYTYVGQTASDKYANLFYDEFTKEFPSLKARTDFSDGDADKESQFYVLRKTKMPAVLVEWFFMDNFHECKEYLMSDNGRDRIIHTMVEGIKRIVTYSD
jgi:N-acetylmuramoyl-L-alanine amidase